MKKEERQPDEFRKEELAAADFRALVMGTNELTLDDISRLVAKKYHFSPEQMEDLVVFSWHAPWKCTG